MFTWNVEDMVLLNQKGGTFIKGKEKIYDCESQVSREDKIAFVDSFQNGKLSYLLSLIEKFNIDKDKLPQDTHGNIKTVSLKAWIRKNDTEYKRTLIDNEFRYGKYRILNCERWITSNYKGNYDIYEDLVDELFHRQLKECERAEHRYFLEHDEYSILKQKFKDRKYDTTFGVVIGECSDGKIYVYSDDNYTYKRKITIDELKYFLSKYEELDKLVERITEETKITV